MTENKKALKSILFLPTKQPKTTEQVEREQHRFSKTLKEHGASGG